MRTLLGCLLLANVFAFGQQAQSPQSVPDQPKTIRLGVAMPYNRSSMSFSTLWERDQLIRSLKLLNKDLRDVDIVAVPLKSNNYKAAAKECADKCDYVVLVTVRDTGGGVNIDNQRGIGTNPVVIGPRIGPAANARPTMVQYDTYRVGGSSRKLGDGSMTTAMSDDVQEDIRLVLDTLAPRMINQIRNPSTDID